MGHPTAFQAVASSHPGTGVSMAKALQVLQRIFKECCKHSKNFAEKNEAQSICKHCRQLPPLQFVHSLEMVWA